MEKKTIVYGLDGKEKETISVPKIFSIKPRKDLISRAVLSIELNEKQAQGRDPLAGKRNTAESWGSGFAAARIPRRKGSGYSGARNAAFIPRVIGGRLAHPPRAEKIITRKINGKEKKLATMNAISATGMKELVQKRGHIFSQNLSFPIVIDDKVQSLKKTSEITEIFQKLGLDPDIERAKNGTNIRAGKGKKRGRKYKKRKSLLLVIKENFGIYQAARNLPGVDVVNINKINCRDLAPGAQAGRLTIWVQSAFNTLNKME